MAKLPHYDQREIRDWVLTYQQHRHPMTNPGDGREWWQTWDRIRWELGSLSGAAQDHRLDAAHRLIGAAVGEANKLMEAHPSGWRPEFLRRYRDWAGA